MADTPVFDNPTGLIGRVNVGGGNSGLTKAASGDAYVRQTDNVLLTTIDFTPLVIFTTTSSMYDENGTSDPCNGTHISYRKQASEDWASLLVEVSGEYLRHRYDESTGQIHLTPYTTYGYQTIRVQYVILGV